MKSSRIGFVIFGVAAAAAAAVGALIFFHDRPRPASSPAAPQAVQSPPASSPTFLSHGRFETLRVYSPAATPTSFVLLLSGDAGWNGANVELAHLFVGEARWSSASIWRNSKPISTRTAATACFRTVTSRI